MTITEVMIIVCIASVTVVTSLRLGQWIGELLARRARKRSAHVGSSVGDANDAPLSDPETDMLGYAPFAQQLAQNLVTIQAPKGFVFAVTGEWGSGKTTLLNFVDHFLRQNEQQVDVVRFNPWWFSGREDLVRRFFDQLQATLRGLGFVDSNTAADIKVFQDALTALGAPNFLRAALTLGTSRGHDIPELKERVSERLAQRDRRLIVFIDDIDRLAPGEISEVLMLVKGVADFPNVVYVLAFDQAVVATSLKEHAGTDGHKYLEKIIQASIDLPAPDPVSLREVFLSGLNQLIKETSDDLFESSQWANLFWDGIAPVLTTPRIVVRLLNAISLTYPTLRHEVNGVDFIGLEVIRVLTNDVYHLIRNNPDHFLGRVEAPQFPLPADNPELAFHHAWLGQIPPRIRPAIQGLVTRLFPRVDAVLGRKGFGGADSEPRGSWKKTRRICHPEVFPIYFQLATPAGSKSRSEMLALLAIVGDQDAFSRHLRDSARHLTRLGTTEARVQLEELLTYIEDIPDEAVRSIVATFFDIGDELLLDVDDGRGFADFGNDIRIGRIVWSLLRRFPEQTRFEYLRDSMVAGDAVALASHEAVTLAQQHGEHSGTPRPHEERIVNRDHLEEIKRIVVEKIEESAKNGTLASRPDLGSILYRWKTWGSEARVRAWVENAVKTDRGFLTLVSAFSRGAQTFGEGDRVARVLSGINLQELSDFLDVDVAVARAHSLSDKAQLHDADRTTIDLLLKAAARRDTGHDPDFPFDT